MDQDPIHKCFGVVKSIIESADTSRIPDAQNAVEKYLAIHLEEQRLFAIEQLDNEIAKLWPANPTGDRRVVLASISAYLSKRHTQIEKQNAAKTP
jgi:hypothetical protein